MEILKLILKVVNVIQRGFDLFESALKMSNEKNKEN